MLCFLLAILLAVTVQSQTDPGPEINLRNARYNNLRIFMDRGNSLAHLQAAYSTSVVTETIVRNNRAVGTFGGPNNIAFEYESTLFVLSGLLGYNPFATKTSFDQYRVTWLEHDFLRTTRLANTSTNWNTTTQKYDIVAQGFMSTSYFRFENSTSARISLLYDITDPASDLLVTGTSSDTHPDAICDTIIGPSCAGTTTSPRPYWSHTGFADLADCKQFMNAIPVVGKCPFPTISNTTRCRRLHALSAYPQPEIHCMHVRPHDSAVCVDRCMPACSNCHANAECNADFPGDLMTAHYFCKCKNGFVGDGINTCAPVQCGLPGQSGCEPQRHVCSENKCKCTDTFVWNAATGDCECPDDHEAWEEDGKQICIRKGRCLADRHCEAQTARTVKCRSYGQNAYTQFNWCLCNHGYQGGLDYPCVCPPDRREVMFLGNKVCLGAMECTTHQDCPNYYNCDAETNTIGTCVPS